ncbi:RrF2 family transcriptional regulator [Haliovirga abyssi]|uniref:Rrf2 family transcriptional regulator n=1 Tax=Haliovirga abyssi TaxID=2996794 RepID=A0AAU9DJ65_9FUSO|nr:Rrf2 family transcriptional regulator [Haliovirga abyssi]BDU49887.1 Rrf2 family transcriptional regulator [Haliovirga abyssi]
MKITTKTRYGIRALIHIAEETKVDGEKLIRIKDIAESQKITVQYLEQILYKLKKGKIIEGKRGPSGGYKIAIDPSNITMEEIFKILESDIKVINCNLSEDKCMGHDCATVYLWNKINSAIEDVLKNMTLNDLLKNHSLIMLGK